MESTTKQDAAAQIVAKVGGAGNILSLTHWRYQAAVRAEGCREWSNPTGLDAIPVGVWGWLPQGGDRYQVVIGGAVQSMYNRIMGRSDMASVGKGDSDADVKARERAKARGKVAWLDNFFEFLSDSFRPILGALLGASPVHHLHVADEHARHNPELGRPPRPARSVLAVRQPDLEGRLVLLPLMSPTTRPRSSTPIRGWASRSWAWSCCRASEPQAVRHTDRLRGPDHQRVPIFGVCR